MATSLKHGLAWAGYKFTSTVLDDIWPGVVFFSGIATMVCCVSKFTSVDLGMNSTTLTVLGTVVSLVVSFKTNNSYGRWWEGRNVWSNLTTNCRQLAMLIWIQVPNIPTPPKDDDKYPKSPFKTEKPSIPSTASPHTTTDDPGLSSIPSAAPAPPPTEHPMRAWHKKGTHPTNHTEPHLSAQDAEEESKGEDQDKKRNDAEKERAILHGIVEKKTYIGLVQAFAVAMKHSLRGEKGPFYSDLYSLIAFLPKYNPSAYPPITRDHLLVLWQNGLPRQKAYKADDVIAIPLTQPASFNGYAFDLFPDTAAPSPAPKSNKAPIDQENHPSGLTTNSSAFKIQAVEAAAEYTKTDDPAIIGFSRLDEKHRLNNNDHKGKENGREEVTITTVELMPPRHPPAPRIWDFIPPLRVLKVIWDWIRRKKRDEEEEERSKGGKRRRGGAVRSEIPQEILMYLSAYVADLITRAHLNSSLNPPLLAALLELQKSMTDLDKLSTTPIPTAYTFHLRLTVWAYLFFLPFQLYQYLGWLTIPATTVAAITYLGFLEIGAQVCLRSKLYEKLKEGNWKIQMPFAYDQSDLDLDGFVGKLSRQLAQVTAFPSSMPSSRIVLSSLNQPFLPTLSMTAPEILGIPLPVPQATTMGFAAAYPTQNESRIPHTSARSPAKSVRDIELALNANWKEISMQTQKMKWQNHQELENKTGVDVAVLAM